MKAISIYQPWASLIVTGAKRIETRSWYTQHRGPLLIHASKAWTGPLQDICVTAPFREALESFGVPQRGHSWTHLDFKRRRSGYDLPLGAIIGLVEVIDCVPTERVVMREDAMATEFTAGMKQVVVDPREHAFGDFTAGRFAWLLSTFTRLPEPIPYSGRMGLFEVADRDLPKGVLV